MYLDIGCMPGYIGCVPEISDVYLDSHIGCAPGYRMCTWISDVYLDIGYVPG